MSNALEQTLEAAFAEATSRYKERDFQRRIGFGNMPALKFFRFNLVGILFVALYVSLGSFASAQSYPSKPIEVRWLRVHHPAEKFLLSKGWRFFAHVDFSLCG